MCEDIEALREPSKKSGISGGMNESSSSSSSSSIAWSSSSGYAGRRCLGGVSACGITGSRLGTLDRLVKFMSMLASSWSPAGVLTPESDDAQDSEFWRCDLSCDWLRVRGFLGGKSLHVRHGWSNRGSTSTSPFSPLNMIPQQVSVLRTTNQIITKCSQQSAFLELSFCPLIIYQQHKRLGSLSNVKKLASKLNRIYIYSPFINLL